MPGLTPKLPFSLSDDDGAYRLIKTYKELVKQNFKNLILTAPGERMMDTHFGVGIRNFLFRNDGPLLYSSIRSKINEQVKKYMPFISVVDVSFISPGSPEGAYMDNNFLFMTIEYAIGPLDTVDKLEITIPEN